MKISIFGMGYVGTASAACLLDDGHEITGIDIDISKMNNLAIGKSPMIQEKEIEKLLLKGYNNGNLLVTMNIKEAIFNCDMIWICVGTPSKNNGEINLSSLRAVISDIGFTLRSIKNRPLIVIRSTCLPGTMDNEIKPLFEQFSGLIVSKDINIIFHPEFLREGSSVSDFKNPAKIIIGEDFKGNIDLLLSLYDKYNVPIFRLTFKEAEMVKYCDNLFHALKITFANEVASISKLLNIDSRLIADIYCSDKKSNISTSYLFPGFAYGGSCLPKDLRAILKFSSVNSLSLPMLEGILQSNNEQIKRLVSRVLSYDPFIVGIIGISFKKGTNDMRESSYVKVAKALIGEGINIKIYDPMISQESLIGSNKKQIEKDFKNISKLLVSSLDELSGVNLIIINHSIVDENKIKKWIKKDIQIIDLIGNSKMKFNSDKYEGLYW